VKRSLLPAVLAIVLTGCSASPPIRYYTLREIPGTALPVAAGSRIAVRLDRVTIPTELDRSQLVRRIDATRLQIVENDRWAAPLEDTIRRVLSDDLASRLPADSVANPIEPSTGDKHQSLSIDIEDFYADTSCSVTLRAAWLLKQPDSGSSRGTEEAHVPGTGGACPGASSIPEAMSQALARISDRIAAAVAHGAQDQ
jgi:uncharacterized lipoprotein YmbA